MGEEAQPGSTVDGRYEVKRLVARGGMAAIFEATHLASGMRVALKALHADLLRSAEARARLLREARALGALRHPNVVQLYDAGECPTHGPYLSLELIEGRPLDGLLLARRRLPVDQSVALLVQLCEALSETHRRGIVHRDVKPANVLVSRTPIGDRVELIDFSIARIDDDTSPKLTQLGDMLGTVDYMSPEQLLGEVDVDALSDVYATGVVLYECLTGEVPFSGPATTVVARIMGGAKPEPLATRGVDAPELDAVLERALRFEAAERFPSVRELALAALAAVGTVPELELLDAQPAGLSIEAEHRRRVATAAAPFAARRQFARAPYVTPARVSFDGGTMDGRTEDISEGGLLVVTDGDVAPNTVVNVRFSLPTSGRVTQVSATTRWARTSRAMRALGLSFVELSDDARADIARYVALMAPR